MKRERHPVWTREALLAAIRERATELGIEPGDLAPLSGQLGASLCNAAHKLFGGKDAACAELGYVPNGKGGSRAAKMRRRGECQPEPIPEPTPAPPDPAIINLAHERALHLERMKRKYAEHPESVPRRLRIPVCVKKPRRHIYVARRGSRWDEFLPPDDLTVPHRRAG